MSKLLRWASGLLTWRATIIGVLLVGALGTSFVGGAYAHKYRDQIKSLLRAVQPGAILSTNLYNITVLKVHVPGEGRDGGIAALEDGVLFVNRKGAIWFVDAGKLLHPLVATVPVNVDDFLADPQNKGLIVPENFGVKDILLQSTAGGRRLLASFNFWYPELDCYTLRVSALEVSVEQLKGVAPATAATWRTVFETTPCYPLARMPGSGSPHATLGAGGRLATYSAREVLLTIGGFKSEGIDQAGPASYWDPANSYGKTVLIDLENGRSRIFTFGHRNPQGLVITSDSQVWLTEHAARGGDELNRLVEGQNYGYPAVSYGTAYEQMVWPTNPRQGRHDGFAKPMFAWVPSIGISQVVVIEHDGFPDWKGDLIVASMAAEYLYHVRIEDGRMIFVEPIRIDHRVRDIIEAEDGSLVLKTDDDFLIYLTRVDFGSAATANLSPIQRGELLATSCMACHSFVAGGPNGIGPNLYGVAGRAIGSAPQFTYSTALRGIGGRWTADALQTFIANPADFAPGTTMARTAILNSAQIADIVRYLESLR